MKWNRSLPSCERFCSVTKFGCHHQPTSNTMTSNLVFCVCAGEVLFLAVANVCSFVPTLVRVFLLKNVEAMHLDPVSDIPGNPHSFSPAIISLFRTLPEPSNFNIVWTGLTLKEPLLIRGDIPLARFSSLSVYGAGSADTPSSIELATPSDNAERAFGIVVVPEGMKDFKAPANCIPVSSNSWKKGFIAMRNYLVPPGTRVTTPEVVRLRDNKVIRPAAVLVAGPSQFDLRSSKWLSSFLVALRINAVLLIGTYGVLHSISATKLVCVAILGAVLGYTLYALCFVLGRARLTQLSKHRTKNAFHLVSLEQGSKTSQPSKLHKYWLVRHDIPANHEIAVKFKIHPDYQKYWSIVVYDEYGLPLPQYYYDGNCFTTPLKTKGKGIADGAYEVDIRVRNGGTEKARGAGCVNVLDCSASPSGYVLMRINHPAGEHVVEYSAPASVLQAVSTV